MSAFRVAFVCFLFLGGNLRAQVDLFEEDRAYKMYGGNTGLYEITRVPAMRVPARDVAPEAVNVELKRSEVSSFRYYVDDGHFDSILMYYNASQFDRMIYAHPGSLISIEQDQLETYCKLFRKVYGSCQGYTPIKREILSLRDSVIKIALLTCEASFNKVAGRLKIALDIKRKEKPLLVALEFTPHDYSEVPFFANISQLTLDYILTSNVMALKKNTSASFAQRLVSEKRLEKTLSVLRCDSIKQFTSSLKLTDNKIIARVIYDMLLEDKYLQLEYINEGKQFKLNDLGLLRKEKK